MTDCQRPSRSLLRIPAPANSASLQNLVGMDNPPSGQRRAPLSACSLRARLDPGMGSYAWPVSLRCIGLRFTLIGRIGNPPAAFNNPRSFCKPSATAASRRDFTPTIPIQLPPATRHPALRIDYPASPRVPVQLALANRNAVISRAMAYNPYGGGKWFATVALAACVQPVIALPQLPRMRKPILTTSLPCSARLWASADLRLVPWRQWRAARHAICSWSR